MANAEKKRVGVRSSTRRKKSRSKAKARHGTGTNSSDTSAHSDWKFGSVASDVVHRAASILEEEIAAGIVAAKQVEARFVRKSEVKDEAPRDDLMQRLRKDAHEAVDVFMDVFSTLSKNLTAMTDRASAAADRDKGPDVGNSADTSKAKAVSLRVSAKPGTTGRATIRVRGVAPAARMCAFAATDLVSEALDRIPASSVAFEPENVMLSAKTVADIEVVFTIPSTTPRGSYTGLINWGSDETSRTVAEVVVG